MTTRKRRIRQEWVRNLARPQVREGVKLAAQTQNGAKADTGPEYDLYIYDVIDSWGGDWGVSALGVIEAISEVESGTINVRLNSPGGDYFEGVAILNALQRHPATVNVYVDGMAASAASVIAMAGEKRVMGLGAQLMIHEASTLAMGGAGDLRKTADMLDQTNDDIAALYAQCMGKDVDVAAVRAQLADETWFTAASAVAAGLATELAKKAEPDDDEDEEDESEEDDDEKDDEDEKAPPFKKKKNEAPDWAAALLAEIRAVTAVSRETAPQSPAGTPPAEPPAPLPSAGFTWSEALVSALTERRSS